MYLALAFGDAQVATAAGAFEKYKVLTLAAAVLIRGIFAHFLSLPAEKTGVFSFSQIKAP